MEIKILRIEARENHVNVHTFVLVSAAASNVNLDAIRVLSGLLIFLFY